MNGQLITRVLTLAILVRLGGCKQPNDGYEYSEALSGPTFTGFWVYDTGTLCTVGDATMHCCPPGTAMIGAHVSDNVFKCAQLTSTQGSRSLDVDTSRNGMHACPPGSVMVGLHVNNHQLACQPLGPGRTAPRGNGIPGTFDSYPMYVCPSGYAMSGIRVSDNLLTCDG